MAVLSNTSFYVETPGKFSELLQARDNGQTVEYADVVKIGLPILSKGIEAPFVYTIIRKTDRVIVGHLVGTINVCNAAMLKNPTIQKAVTNSSLILMDKLPQWYHSTPADHLRGRVSTLENSDDIGSKWGVNIFMGPSLCAIAKSHHIECQEMDTDLDRTRRKITEENFKSSLIDDEELGPHIVKVSQISQSLCEISETPCEKTAVAKGTSVWMNSRNKFEKLVEFLEWYQKGSYAQMNSFFVNTAHWELRDSTLSTNAHWANKFIIPAFQNLRKGTNPVCVLIGINHLLGPENSQNNLLKILEENGFIIRRFHPEKRTVKKTGCSVKAVLIISSIALAVVSTLTGIYLKKYT